MSKSPETIWSRNEHGLWCECCGNLIASPRTADADDYQAPEQCGQCGFPDPESVAAYHFGDEDDSDDGLDEDGNPPFECARFWIKGEGWYCPMAGSEECDWECLA